MFEYLIYKRLLKTYQKTDLEDSEKIKLGAFDKDIIKKLFNNWLDNLSNELLNENISREYALWYKQALFHILSYFKTYK